MTTKSPGTYAVGIDLGTSNSALAFAKDKEGAVNFLEVEQIESPGRVSTHRLLPSVHYIPHEGEVTPDDVRLPWQERGDTQAVTGAWARGRGAEVPDRLVSSAKSWLCNTHVDRLAPVLPWKSEIQTGKCSPVDASRRYLEHLKLAFLHERERVGETVDLAASEIVLTVPASFDEVARTVTYEAAREAGLPNVTLLEEPQAAFYAWLDEAEDWRAQVKPGDLVLVCDVGGGTTDFSMVVVTEQDKEVGLERISVGDHLLLGGDNMDLTLAYTLKARFEASGTQLDHWQLLSLVASCRQAKERILGDEGLDEVPISVASRGSSLFAATLSETLDRATVEKVLLEGFFPLTRLDDLPKARRGSGIQELGLGYETEPAVSKHLARFLHRSRQNVESDARLRSLLGDLKGGESHLMPSAILFNGGVFNAKPLRERVTALLAEWNGGEPVKELVGARLDLAVAAGAARYGRIRADGQGFRIRAGTARSYYIGLESPMPAVPGIEPPVKGLCLVPQGTEEGSELELPERQFGLVVGEPVEFRLFSSAVRAGDEVGSLVSDATRDLEESGRLSVTLPAGDDKPGETVPVHLDAEVTEVGTLQLSMKHATSSRRWNLEFNVRSQE